MASTSSVDLKLCEIELPSNLACKETLNRLLSQNALWTAFHQLENTKVTNEQRVLEVKIERTFQQLTEISQERVKGVLRSNPNIVLADKIQTPDIMAQRNKRLEFVQMLQQMPQAPNCKALSDCICEQKKSANADLSHPVNVLNVIACECRRSMQELQQMRRIVAARSTRLSHHQLADDSLQRHLRSFGEQCSKETHIFEQCLSTIDSFLLQHKLPTAVSCDALPSGMPACPVHIQHIAAITRGLVHRVSSRFAVDVFTSRFAWTVVSEDVSVKAELARMRSSAAAMINSLNSTSGKGIPIMFSLIEQFNPILETLRSQFAIVPTISQQDGQPFLFAAHKVATTLFALQAADCLFPAYGSAATPTTRIVTLPAAQVMQANAANPRPVVAAADFRTTYLKGCPWFARSQMVLIPKEDNLQVAQQHFFNSFGSDIDHVLQVEFTFLAETDLAVAGARIEDLVHSHMLRATPASESDIGPIGQGGMITLQSISKQSQTALVDSMKTKKSNAEADSLLPLYWLRYAQTRQLRRKLSAFLNYFASVRRRLTLDAVSSETQDISSADVGHDAMSCDADGIVRITDANGVRVMYDCVSDEVKETELFLVNAGTMYLRKFRDRFVPDRAVMCHQLYENEVAFVEAKFQLISTLMLAYDHCVDPQHQAVICQHIADAIARKPLLDSSGHTFIPSYASSVELMRLESAFVSDVVSALLVNEHHMTPLQPADAELLCGQKYRSSILSTPCAVSGLHHSYFDVYSSVSSVADALECVSSVCSGLCLLSSGGNAASVGERMLIHRAIFHKAVLDWRILLEEQLLSQQLIHRRSMQTADAAAAAPLPVGAPSSGTSNIRAGPGQSAFSASIDSGLVMADIFLILCKQFDPHETLVITQDSMPALCRTVGLIMYRRLLAATAVDCSCIEQTLQALASQLSLNVSMAPLSFDEDTVFLTSDSGPSCSIVGLCHWAVNTRLHCSYIDTCGPSFDLSSVTGILQVIGESNHLPTFHSWLMMQTCEMSALSSILLYNNLLWRHPQEKLAAKMKSLQETLPVGVSFDVQPNAKFLSPDHQQALLKATEAFKKAEAAEMQQIASKFLVPLQFLKPMRSALVEAHKKEVAKILQQFKLERLNKSDAGKVGDPIRQSKLSSAAALYIPQVLEACMLLACHSQTLTAAAAICSKAQRFPQGPSPWILKASGSDERNDRYNLSISLCQGFFPAHSSLSSLWHLPQSLDSFQDLPTSLKDAQLFCRLMQSWLSWLIMSEFWHSLSLISEDNCTRNEESIMQLVKSDVMRCRALVEGCSSISTVADFVVFFENLQQIMYMKVLLCLTSHVRRHLADDYELGVWKTRALLKQLTDGDTALPASHLRTLNLSSSASAFGTVSLNGPCSGILNRLGVLQRPLLPPTLPAARLSRIALDLVNISAIIDDKQVDTSTPEKLIAAQLRACASVHALERFQDELVKLHFGSVPNTSDEFIKAAELIDSRVNVQLLRANERLNDQASAAEALALQGKGSKPTGPAYDFSSESAVRLFLCAASCEAVCVALLEKQYKAIALQHAKALTETDALATLPPSDGLSKAYDSVSKVDILIDFVSDCRSNWSQRPQPDGSVVISMPEVHLGRCIDRLAQRLRSWGQLQADDFKKDLLLQHNALLHQVHLLQNNLKDLQLQVDVEQRSMARRLDTAITDRCYELLYKVQDLSGKLKAEKRNLLSLESTVRDNLKKEFQTQISDLNSQLMVVKGQFAEYRESLESDMKINLHDIRKEALMKMVSSSNVPQELKNTTLQMKVNEDQVAELTAENFQLKRAINKLRILQKLKDETSRSLFSKRVEASESAKKHASKELYVTMDEVEQRSGMLNRQLADLQNALLASEARCDKLRKELEHSQHNKQNLLQWKLSRAPLLDELEAKVAKYERWSHIDVDRLVSELEKRESEVRQLQREVSSSSGSLSRPTTAMSTHSQGDGSGADVKRLKAALLQEQKMKAMAQQKLEAIRREMLLGQPGPLSSAAVSAHEKFYQNKCDALMEEIAKAMLENKRLWQVIRDSGIDTGDNVVSSASTRAPSRSSTTPFDSFAHRPLHSAPLLMTSPTSPPSAHSRTLSTTPTPKRPTTASGSGHRVVSAMRTGGGSPL